MTNAYTPVSTKQYDIQSKEWMDAISRGDSISIMFFRMTDRLRRIQQFIDDFNLREQPTGAKQQYVFLVLDSVLHNHTIEDREDLIENIVSHLNYKRLGSPKRLFEEWIEYFKVNSIRLVLIIPQAEEYHNMVGQNMMSWFRFVVQQYDPHISLMSFYEIDVTHPQNVGIFSEITNLEQRVMYYPLYDGNDTSIFIEYLGRKWDTSISEEQKREILDQCGGHFWFVKEAVRQIRDHGTWSIDNEDMQFRLRTIHQLLLQSEQNALKKVITDDDSFTADERQSIEYFQKLNMVTKSGKCSVKLLENYLLAKTTDLSNLVVIDGQIVYNNVPLDTFFSKKEYRVLKLLLEQKNDLITRDQIAKVVWPLEGPEAYSDWAIDQIVARLRRRLKQLSLPPSLVKSVRGKGYKIQL